MRPSIRKTKKHVRKNKRSNIKKKLSKTRKMVVQKSKRSKRYNKSRKYSKKARGGISFRPDFLKGKKLEEIRKTIDTDMDSIKAYVETNMIPIDIQNLKYRYIEIEISPSNYDYSNENLSYSHHIDDEDNDHFKMIVCDRGNNLLGKSSMTVAAKSTACLGSGVPNISQFFKTLQMMIKYYLDNEIVVVLKGQDYGGGIANQIAETDYKHMNKLLFVYTIDSLYYTRNHKIPRTNIINLYDTNKGSNMCTINNPTVTKIEGYNNDKHNNSIELLNNIISNDKKQIIKTNNNLKKLGKVIDDLQNNKINRIKDKLDDFRYKVVA